jgi:hypothetical protein
MECNAGDPRAAGTSAGFDDPCVEVGTTVKRPNFFIVGAPKCGTTSLSEYLRSHPNVFMSSPKEPHFFATDLYPRNPEGIDSVAAYLQLFTDARDQHQVVGEASASYMFSDAAIPAIH